MLKVQKPAVRATFTLHGSESLAVRFARAYRKWLKDPWYYLKCLVWHQYHVVRCEKLQPTWHDRSELIMHVAFQCLVDFVEKEHPWELEATLEEFKRLTT